MKTTVLPQRGICAHRGETETHPENTVAAFRRAAAMGAHQIEFDVQLTKDGHPVVMHDPTVDRTTDGSGKISDLTFAEIRKLDAGGWKSDEFRGERVPTLEEALAAMPRNVWVNVHLKEGYEVGVIAAREVVKQGRQHQAFLAAGTQGIQGARSVFRDVLVCNMERQSTDPSDYVDDTLAKSCHFIQCWMDVLSPENTAKVREAGIRTNLFALNEPAALADTFGAGIDFPLTDYLTGMMAAAEKLGIQPLEAEY